MRSYCSHMMMTASRKKKTLLYTGFIVLSVFALIHVTYFNEAYSPLQVLSDARSEARRLLRFITLYHYQCNNTLPGMNSSSWPICVERVGGLNLVLGGQRVMYSVGPTKDYNVERVLALNYSYSVYIFHHERLSPKFIQTIPNTTHLYNKIIVPNDPADYGRNSYETQTLNNMFDLLQHTVVDILKIEMIADMSHSHELLEFVIKDKLLSRVRQLHLMLSIDKVDDDYLYSWYRALYMLFHNEGFRLYHTDASDTLCVQVTLMESCVYYMSWIRNPGPETFVMFPPAMDGSDRFEVDRLLDYMEKTDASCEKKTEVKIPSASTITLCLDRLNMAADKPCELIVFRDADVSGYVTSVPNTKCSVLTLELNRHTYGNGNIYVKRRRNERSVEESITLGEALQAYITSSHSNVLYIDITEGFWDMLTEVLNRGALYHTEQIILNIRGLTGIHNSVDIRRRYSELMRVEAYGFNKYRINGDSKDNKLTFRSKAMAAEQDLYKINYVRVKSV